MGSDQRGSAAKNGSCSSASELALPRCFWRRAEPLSQTKSHGPCERFIFLLGQGGGIRAIAYVVSVTPRGESV
jgi:hypothetical protein